jgi:hypothetical protein
MPCGAGAGGALDWLPNAAAARRHGDEATSTEALQNLSVSARPRGSHTSTRPAYMGMQGPGRNTAAPCHSHALACWPEAAVRALYPTGPLGPGHAR